MAVFETLWWLSLYLLMNLGKQKWNVIASITIWNSQQSTKAVKISQQLSCIDLGTLCMNTLHEISQTNINKQGRNIICETE